MRLSCLLFGLAFSVSAISQQKMDLDDVSIKGELHSDERLRMLARDRNQLRNYVQYRTSYKSEMIEGLMRPEPQYQYQPSSPAATSVDMEEDSN